jgi:hypothetical protein
MHRTKHGPNLSFAADLRVDGPKRCDDDAGALVASLLTLMV